MKILGTLLVVTVLTASSALGQEPPRGSVPPFRAPAADAPRAPVGPPPMAPPTAQPDGRVSVHLKDGSRIVGKLVGLDKLKLKASFGEIAVPVDSILGLRVTEQGSGSGTPAMGVTILFRNGDVLTAEPFLATLKLETVWGDASIAGKHVESLVMTAERMAWVWDGRWRLVNEGTTGSGPGMPRVSYPSPYGPGPYTSPDPFIPPSGPAPPTTPVAPSFGPPAELRPPRPRTP